LSSNNEKSIILFRIGFVGHVTGFLGWFTWFFLVILNLIAYLLGYGHLGGVSGIFFQSGAYSLIVYSFFLTSFLLGGFACFGLKKRYNSNIALLCGFVYLAGFAMLCYSIVSLYLLRNYFWITPYFLAFLNIGMLAWGATLLEVRKSLPYPKLSLLTGIILMFIAVASLTWFWQAFLYWGIEFWFTLFGWLYAIGTLVTALIL